MDFNIGQVLRLLIRTLPFVALRLIVYTTITLAYTVFTGTGKVAGRQGDSRRPRPDRLRQQHRQGTLR